MALDSRPDYRTLHAAQRMQLRFSRRMRARRMELFERTMRPARGARVIDLGGTPRFWRDCEVALDVTIVNLPGALTPGVQSHHTISYAEGDACALPELPDQTFDIAVSNSVIEHVGPFRRRRALAREVRRLARAYWVQTPSAAFPVEPHNFMPFWWFYPDPLRNRFLRRWRRRMPARARMIEETTVLSRAEMRDLFPDAELMVERFALLPKSYIAYRL